jgi:signal transduction histidine kinase
MIDLSRIDAQLLQLNLEDVSITALLRLILEEISPWLQERRQTVEIEGLADLPRIEGDGQRLHQAFLNVISNSIKFTPDGGEIAISCRLLEGQGAGATDYVEVVIKDNGIGIDREDQEHIFERFYRVGDARHHSTGQYKFRGAGPGLGLPITRGIVEAHGGRVWAESEGHDEETCPGTELHVVLPVVQVSLHNAEAETMKQLLDVGSMPLWEEFQ